MNDDDEDGSSELHGGPEMPHAAADGGVRRGDLPSILVGALCDQLTDSTSVDGAAVAILTGDRRTRELLYATDATARALDELQFTLGEGPCLDAYIHNWPQLWAHLDTTIAVDALWPGFAVEAIRLGARAIFAFPIHGRSGPVGVFELYRNTAGPLSPGEAECAADCAGAIADALPRSWPSHHARSADVGSAIDAIDTAARDGVDPFTRSAVHIAAGITAIQLNTSPNVGLELLRAYAYAQQLPTSAVASDIIGRRLSLRDSGDGSS